MYVYSVYQGVLKKTKKSNLTKFQINFHRSMGMTSTLKKIIFVCFGWRFDLQRQPRALYRSKYFCLQSTLNLCLKMPDTEQKTRTQSDQHGLRKRPKTAEICRESKICVFHQFFDVFSAHDGRIKFSSFALCQES